MDDAIFDDFQKLADDHKDRLGVLYVVTNTGSTDEWTFHSFYNYSGIKGRGAEALREVCELADHHGIELSLWCVRPKLFPYYEAFGFKMRPGRDDTDVKYFDRTPTQKQMAA